MKILLTLVTILLSFGVKFSCSRPAESKVQEENAALVSIKLLSRIKDAIVGDPRTLTTPAQKIFSKIVSMVPKFFQKLLKSFFKFTFVYIYREISSTFFHLKIFKIIFLNFLHKGGNIFLYTKLFVKFCAQKMSKFSNLLFLK